MESVDAGILPVKRLDRAKARLSTHLQPDQRRRVAEALLDDALELCASSDFITWWVVSDDGCVLEKAADRGFNVIEDPGVGLNPALSLAIEEIAARGWESVTVIPSDAPLAFRGDLVDLLDTGATSEMVLVPSDDGGTNALYMAPPDLVAPEFGQGSLRKHLDLADRNGIRCALLALPRLALDIDTIEHARAFLNKPIYGDSRTAAVLRELRPHLED